MTVVALPFRPRYVRRSPPPVPSPGPSMPPNGSLPQIAASHRPPPPAATTAGVRTQARALVAPGPPPSPPSPRSPLTSSDCRHRRRRLRRCRHLSRHSVRQLSPVTTNPAGHRSRPRRRHRRRRRLWMRAPPAPRAVRRCHHHGRHPHQIRRPPHLPPPPSAAVHRRQRRDGPATRVTASPIPNRSECAPADSKRPCGWRRARKKHCSHAVVAMRVSNRPLV